MRSFTLMRGLDGLSVCLIAATAKADSDVLLSFAFDTFLFQHALFFLLTTPPDCLFCLLKFWVTFVFCPVAVALYLYGTWSMAGLSPMHSVWWGAYLFLLSAKSVWRPLSNALIAVRETKSLKAGSSQRSKASCAVGEWDGWCGCRGEGEIALTFLTVIRADARPARSE